jgi:hypothetical protein
LADNALDLRLSDLVTLRIILRFMGGVENGECVPTRRTVVDFWATIVLLLRRWYVALPGFVLSLGAAAGFYSSVPTRYVSTSVIVLTAPIGGPSLPADPQHPNPLTNPLLNFDSGLSFSATMLIQTLSTPEVAHELGVEPGGDTTVEVTNGSTNPELLEHGPFVFVHGESISPAKAQSVAAAAVQRAHAELTRRQVTVHAPAPTRISFDEVVPPTTPVPQRGGKQRAAAATVAFGGIGSLASTFAVDSIIDAYHRRRAQRSAAQAPPPETPR